LIIDVAAPAINSVSVPGSGTATAAAEFETGAPATDGSKMNDPPAPTVKLDPSGRAVAFVT